MSDDLFDMFDDEGNNEGSPTQTPKGLRDWAKKLQEQNEELIAWKRDREAVDRRSSLASALDGAGKDPAAVSLIPADVTDADGVTKWLEANGALIKDKATEGTEGQEQPTPGTQSVLTEEDEKKLAAVSGAPSGAAPPSVQSPELDDIAQAESETDFWKRLESHQGQQSAMG